MNFDLNIDNYSLKELSDLYDLPSNYDINMVSNRQQKMIQSIMGDVSIPPASKISTVQFITQVKDKLTSGISNSNMSNLAKTYANVYNLDKTLQHSDIITAGSTNIIKQPTTPYGQYSPSEFYQGVINPLNKRILRQNIKIKNFQKRSQLYMAMLSEFD